MTDQRPIDVSALRDGDIVRAKRGEYGVVEGVFRLHKWGRWSLYDNEERGERQAIAGVWTEWTITDILRPVLVKGDRVEWVGASRKRKASTATVCQVNGDYVAVIRDDDVADKWPIEAVRRLPAAPEPAPIDAWDWWADEKGIPHVVEVLHDDSVGLRRWTASVVNRFVEPSLLRDYWTRLDGPPEPPEGSVVRLGQKGNRIPLAAMRCNDVWRVTGYQEPLSWADLTGFATVDLATLQIVHTLGVE